MVKKKTSPNQKKPAVWDEMDDYMEESFNDPFWLRPLWMGGPDWPKAPKFFEETRMQRIRTDISENKNAYKISVDLPGIDPDDVDVDVSENSVIISAKREEEKEEKGEKTHKKECRYGEFYRHLTIPKEVDPSEVKAKAKHGMLEITLPKLKKSKKKIRKVKIKKD